MGATRAGPFGDSLNHIQWKRAPEAGFPPGRNPTCTHIHIHIHTRAQLIVLPGGLLPAG